MMSMDICRWLSKAVLTAALVALTAMSALGCRREYRGPAMPWDRLARVVSDEPRIRVAVLSDATQVRIQCYGKCDVATGPGAKTLSKGRPVDYRIEPGARGLRVNGGRFEGNWISFRPRQGAQVLVNKSPYPGAVRVIRSGGALVVVNIVPLERYLCGVVGKEMYSHWESEALQAQAIAARSFALFRMKRRQKHAYDLVAPSISQCYAGGAVASSVTDAVAQTRGICLTHNAQVAPAYFHSTCGGHSAGAGDVFGGKDESYIEGVRCPFCAGGRRFAWEVEVSAREVRGAIFGAGPGAPQVAALQAMQRRDDGRPAFIRVYTESGHRDVKTARFRAALGRSRIKSSRFWITTSPKGFLIIGRGFGHGVGMCQYGAQGMAKQGATAQQILRHYYPNLKLAKTY